MLTELRLGLCGIGNEGTTSLTETLRNIPTLRVLDLSGNAVPSTAIKDLCKSYVPNCSYGGIGRNNQDCETSHYSKYSQQADCIL